MYKKIIFISSLLFSISNATDIDSTTGLIIDEGLGDIKENCTVCHTGRFVVVNGGNRAFWKKKIYIMQEAYGLWKIDKEAKERMLKYLSKNYSKKVNVSINK
jgi:hypothetical protein